MISDTNIETDVREKSIQKKKTVLRNAIGYWILGFTNFVPAGILISASFDVLSRFNDGSSNATQTVINVDITSNTRECNLLSTGVFLIVATLPGVLVKCILPFLPMIILYRVLVCAFVQVTGYLLIAYADTRSMVFIGLGTCASFISLGESSYLAYSKNYDKNVLTTWASGSGAAALLGSLIYATLKSIGLSTSTIILLLLLNPLAQTLDFYLILTKPTERIVPAIIEEIGTLNEKEKLEIKNDNPKIDPEKMYDNGKQPLTSLADKFKYSLTLIKYAIPLFLVYLLEFLINQGLYELIQFHGIWLDHGAQYRWYITVYHLGVFISRTMGRFIIVKNLWLFAVLQFLNLIFFTFEAIYMFVPTIWIIFVIIFWEGLLGGSSYSMTFYNMSTEIPEEKKYFAFGVVTIFDTSGILLAGILSIPLHNAICLLPAL